VVNRTATGTNAVLQRFEIGRLHLIKSFLNVRDQLFIRDRVPAIRMKLAYPLALRAFDLLVAGFRLDA